MLALLKLAAAVGVVARARRSALPRPLGAGVPAWAMGVPDGRRALMPAWVGRKMGPWRGGSSTRGRGEEGQVKWDEGGMGEGRMEGRCCLWTGVEGPFL